MTKIKVLVGDIADLPIHVDALVNAANKELIPGGGVDGALNSAAGPQLAKDMQSLGGTPTGTAIYTKAYNLNADYVIHAVGPMYQDGNHNEPELLRSAYESVFKIAKELKIKSIAFPLLSAGVYHYPMDNAISIAIDVMKKYSDEFEIYFVAFGADTTSRFARRTDDVELIKPE